MTDLTTEISKLKIKIGKLTISNTSDVIIPCHNIWRKITISCNFMVHGVKFPWTSPKLWWKSLRRSNMRIAHIRLTDVRDSVALWCRSMGTMGALYCQRHKWGLRICFAFKIWAFWHMSPCHVFRNLSICQRLSNFLGVQASPRIWQYLNWLLKSFIPFDVNWIIIHPLKY